MTKMLNTTLSHFALLHYDIMCWATYARLGYVTLNYLTLYYLTCLYIMLPNITFCCFMLLYITFIVRNFMVLAINVVIKGKKQKKKNTNIHIPSLLECPLQWIHILILSNSS